MLNAIVLLILAGAPLLADNAADWQLVWGDDFNGAANSAPDPAKWTYNTGASGWGNQELENYTNSRQNSYQDGNGNLVIQALKSGSQYTSARLKTQGLFSIAYGRIEARIKVPFGQGLWPAFWMLGANIDQVSWPNCGEIDIMENIGKEPAMVHGTVHGPGDNGGIGGSYTLPGSAKFSDDFHVFTVIWDPNQVQFQVDGNTYETVTKQQAGNMWTFDHKFFLLLNVAVGGSWPGNPDTTTSFPQTMTVDYVHVYRSNTRPIAEPGGVVDAAAFKVAMAPGGLATVFGTGLSDAIYEASKLYDGTKFVSAINGISTTVNGKFAPMTFIAPGQINFQVPADTPIGPASVEVHVTRSGTSSNSQMLTFSQAAPSAFTVLSGNNPDTAVLTCYHSDGTPGAAVAAGTICALWGNNFGPKQTPYADGTGAPLKINPVKNGPCVLSIKGTAADIKYCGAAPGLIIDQLNFVYPSGIAPGSGPVTATLQIGTATGTIKLPAPTT